MAFFISAFAFSITISITVYLSPNVQDEPRPQLARLVLLGARGVTAVVVGSGAWFGSVVFIFWIGGFLLQPLSMY